MIVIGEEKLHKYLNYGDFKSLGDFNFKLNPESEAIFKKLTSIALINEFNKSLYLFGYYGGKK